MNSRTKNFILPVGLLLLSPHLEAQVPDPSQETFRISQTLKPIADEEWERIAGGQIAENYQVSKGDTLYGISKNLFGDPYYWPKVWALNNKKITNPHLIRPGQQIHFRPGSGSSLPSLGENKEKDFIPFQASGRSEEWKELPRQRWEVVPVALPQGVDPDGFDPTSKIRWNKAAALSLEAHASTAKIEPLGIISGSRSEASFLGLNDTIFIQGNQLAIGELYTITKEPAALRSEKSERTGYSYLNMGTIKVIAQQGEVFVGTIVSSKVPIFRENLVVPYFEPQSEPSPIDGPEAIEGTLLVDRNFSTYTVAQHKQVFVDRGSEDGVSPGMIFRAYQHLDPQTEDKLTDQDFIILGDFLVVQVSEQFSSLLAIDSKNTIQENTSIVLLTDVSQILRGRENRVRSKGVDSLMDDLDALDDGDELTEEEKRELEQLENWEENPEDAIEETPEESLEDEILDQDLEDSVETAEETEAPDDAPEVEEAQEEYKEEFGDEEFEDVGDDFSDEEELFFE